MASTGILLVNATNYIFCCICPRLLKGQRRFCSDAELAPYLVAATQRRRRLRYGYTLAVNGSATLDRHDLPKSALDGYRAASGNLVFLAPGAERKPVLAQ
jgi:hypothetical protein